MLLNDLLDVTGVYLAVPHRLRIDDDHWPMLALIQAAGLVGPDLVLETGSLDRVLESRFKFFASVRKAARPGRRLVALVGTEEEMMFKKGHSRSIPPEGQRCTGVFSKECRATLFF
jgi:hypothetical protein